MTQVARAVLVASAVCAAVITLYPASVAHSTVAKASKKNPPVQREPVIRKMIVKLRNPKAEELTQPLGSARVSAFSQRAGVSLQGFRAMSMRSSVLRLETPVKLSEARAIAARIATDPEVLYAEPDMPVRAALVPPDASYALREWHYFGPTEVYIDRGLDVMGNKVVSPTGGANLPGAWNITQGSPSIVVALIDSGVTLTHPELAAALLPGFDFVSSNAQGLPANFVANDGNGRDNDPTDPGDFITAADQTNFPECDDPGTPNNEQIPSSWHGTHMAGTIIGQWGNGVGANPPPGTSTAGIAPNARLLPVRALGKCGGDSSDVIDAMLWSVGMAVPNVPQNQNPARIINMSLGAQSPTCSASYNAAVAAVSGQALVIAASGNLADVVGEPANCPGVLAVTAHTINGDNADYANVGPEVGVSSPGGGTSFQLVTNPQIVETDIGFYTWSSILLGATTPASTDGGNPPRSGPGVGGFTGTSGATAIVSGVAALVLSAKPTLTTTELRTVLVTNVRPHPPGGFCATGQPGAGFCGSGLLDATAAVSSVAPPPSSGGGGGGGALPLAQLLLLGLFVFLARRRGRA